MGKKDTIIDEPKVFELDEETKIKYITQFNTDLEKELTYDGVTDTQINDLYTMYKNRDNRYNIKIQKAKGKKMSKAVYNTLFKRM